MGKVQKLKEDDFFVMNKTFSIWLIKKKSKIFDDLSSSKQRKYFKKFMKKWNKQDLSTIYYDEEKLCEKYGDLLKQKSGWNLKNEDTQISKLVKEYQDALSGVNQMYDFKNDEKIHSKEIKRANRTFDQDKDEVGEVRKTRNEVEYDREQQRDNKREQDKYDRRRERKNQEDLLDELVPKKEGKEALLEKKRMLNQKINGRDRDNTGVDDYDDDFLMGGDSFAKAKAREEQFQRRRSEKQSAHRYEREQKTTEYRQYEDKVMSETLDRSSYMNKYK